MDSPPDDKLRQQCMEKLTWPDEETARAAAAYARYQYGDGDGRVEPYRCRQCGKWHLARAD